jgi:hypothetical protein
VASPGLPALGGAGEFSWSRRAQYASAPARRFESPRGAGRVLTRGSIRNDLNMAPRSWELTALSLLAGFGFGLALDRGDLIFVAVFGAACGMAIVGGMQRFP